MTQRTVCIRYQWAGVALLALALVLAPPALAQEEGADEGVQVAQADTGAEPEEEMDDSARTIEEIVVTATKREQSIQDVPIAVSAFPGEELVSRGIDELEDLQQVSPSLSVYASNSTSNGGTLRIRGVGTTGNNPGLEAAVGTFIDGVYRSRAGLAFSDFVDIERIEVLRGPQGTLFGKNTSAGAVHIISKKPEWDWGFESSASFGSYDLRKFTSNVTGPIIQDVLAFRLAGSVTDRNGYYDAVGIRDNFNDRKRWSIRGQLLWTPTPDLEVRVIGDYADRDETCCPAGYRFVGPTGDILRALGGTIPQNFDEDDLKVGVNFDPFEDIEDWGIQAEVTWDTAFGTVTSITAYRDFDVFRGQDIDFSDVDVLLPQNTEETFENFSQELRVQGNWGDLDYLGGFYIYTEDVDTSAQVRFSTQGGAYTSALLNAAGASLIGTPTFPVAFVPGDFPTGAGYAEDYEQNTFGWSFFTHNVYNFTEELSGTLGMRFSHEEKDGEGIINGAAENQVIDEPFCAINPFVGIALRSLCGNASFDGDREENEITGTAKLAYQLSEELNLYAGYSRGYKAGGYNLDQEANDIDPATGLRTNASEFSPEFSNSYEIGVKSTSFDGRLTANVTAFYTQYEDFQLNTFTGLGFFISNLEEVKSKGIELETFLFPTEGVQASFGVTWADTRYGDRLPGNEAIEGQRITHAPVWQGSAALFAERTLNLPVVGEWTAFFNSNLSYRGRHNTGSDLAPIKQQDAFWLLNSAVGMRSPDGRYELSLWGNNLTDERPNGIVFNSVFQGGSFSTFTGPPRMWGLTLKVAIL